MNRADFPLGFFVFRVCVMDLVVQVHYGFGSYQTLDEGKSVHSSTSLLYIVRESEKTWVKPRIEKHKR